MVIHRLFFALSFGKSMPLLRLFLLIFLVSGCTPLPKKTATAGDEAAERAAADTRKALASGETGLIYANSRPEEKVEEKAPEKPTEVAPLTLVVRTDGSVLYQGIQIAPADFASRFAGHTKAILQVEESLEYAKLVAVIDQLRDAGVTEVAIAPANPSLP